MKNYTEGHLRNLLTKVRRILPMHAEFITEAEDRSAPRGWVAHAREELDAVCKAVEEADEYLR